MIVITYVGESEEGDTEIVEHGANTFLNHVIIIKKKNNN